MALKHLAGSLIVLMAVLGAGCQERSGALPSPSSVQGGAGLDAKHAPDRAFVAEVFVDYGLPTHFGPGPHPTEESDDYQLFYGGARWFAGGTVEYVVTGSEAVGGGNAAIVTAEETWDTYVTARAFSRNDSTSQTNPCTEEANTIAWAPIDGSGGVLASTSICRNVATKEIVGFELTIDTGDVWNIGSLADTFDVENVVSHEWGHVAGLGHDNPPGSGCLTMYKYAGEAEIQKRTLGYGDKLGMQQLYGFVNTDPGSCGS